MILHELIVPGIDERFHGDLAADPPGRLCYLGFTTMLQHYDQRNRGIVANINGELLPRDRAGVRPFDSVVQGGDAVWEGLRLYNGRIFGLTKHLDRLRDSAKALAFESIPTHETLTEELHKTLAANDMTAAERQFFYGLYDLSCHVDPDGDVDTTQLGMDL